MPLPWLIVIIVAVEIALGISPKADRLTWALENLPVWIGLVLLAFTHRSFPLSRLCLNLFALHAVILAVGGYYTYAHVPLGDWVKDALDLKRNHYDRLGHFAQGFVPAIFVRELLLRTSPLRRGKWLAFLSVSVCLAFSAAFELFEWFIAVATGDGAPAYLGTQGDVWDAQWDMLMALLGASLALAFLGRRHDTSIAALPGTAAKRAVPAE
jgi:putative membrane protein